MLRLITIALVFFLGSTSRLVAQDNWINLAEASVNTASTSIVVDLGHISGRVRKLRMSVKSGSLGIVGIKLIYKHVDAFEESYARPIRLGVRPVEIDPGQAVKFLKSLEIKVKKSKPKSKTRTLILQGIQTEDDQRALYFDVGEPTGRSGGQCKSERVTATSRRYILRTIGAYQGSWAAWRKAVKEKDGDGWQAWRRARERKIFCLIENGKWTCTRSAYPCRPGSSASAAICDGPAITRKLRSGDSGDEVKTLQCLLRNYHGSEVAIDGDFGPSTRREVEKFQKKHGLKVDGVLNNRTLEALLDGDGEEIATPCVQGGKVVCTPVRLFFATDRQRQDKADRIAYGAKRSTKLQLGRAVVTVPRVDRKKGEIKLPTSVERLLGTPPEGDPQKHFFILPNGFKVFADASSFIKEVRSHAVRAERYKDHAFVFIHGYRVSFDHALFRTAQMAYDLGYDKPDGTHVSFGTPILYSWPSAGKGAAYRYDRDSADLTVERLQSFIEMVAKESRIGNIHLIAHSMGNVALLQALARLSTAGKPGVKINQVILAAPDVDPDVFRKLTRDINRLVSDATMYASAKDIALQWSRRFNNNRPLAGYVPKSGPLVVPNVYTIDISALSTKLFWGHAEYADNKILLNDMARIFVSKDDRHPPDARNNNFLRRGSTKNSYWRYAD